MAKRPRAAAKRPHRPASRTPPGARRPASPPTAMSTTPRCDLCGEATSGTPRHASASECFVVLRQALDAAREDVTLARGRLAVAEHRAHGAEEALQAVADLLRGETTPKALPRLVARIKALLGAR